MLIQSSRQNDRATGLKDLVHILKHNRGKPSLDALGNKAYLALCETLFQSLRDDRASFLRSKSRNPKAATLLPLSAAALRQHFRRRYATTPAAYRAERARRPENAKSAPEDA